MRQRPSWYHYIIPFLLKTLGVAVFGCYLSFYFLCVSKFDFKSINSGDKLPKFTCIYKKSS